MLHLLDKVLGALRGLAPSDAEIARERDLRTTAELDVLAWKEKAAHLRKKLEDVRLERDGARASRAEDKKDLVSKIEMKNAAISDLSFRLRSAETIVRDLSHLKLEHSELQLKAKDLEVRLLQDPEHVRVVRTMLASIGQRLGMPPGTVGSAEEIATWAKRVDAKLVECIQEVKRDERSRIVRVLKTRGHDDFANIVAALDPEAT